MTNSQKIHEKYKPLINEAIKNDKMLMLKTDESCFMPAFFERNILSNSVLSPTIEEYEDWVLISREEYKKLTNIENNKLFSGMEKQEPILSEEIKKSKIDEINDSITSLNNLQKSEITKIESKQFLPRKCLNNSEARIVFHCDSGVIYINKTSMQKFDISQGQRFMFDVSKYFIVLSNHEKGFIFGGSTKQNSQRIVSREICNEVKEIYGQENTKQISFMLNVNKDKNIEVILSTIIISE